MTLLPSMRTKEQLLEDEKALLAEIERLRELLGNSEQLVERLRDQVTRLSTLVDTERSLHDAEIERLRTEARRWKEAYDFRMKNHAADLDEIAHLKQLLAQATLWHRQFPISEVTHAE